MPTSLTSISNLALVELGHTLIASPTDGSKAANLINEVWDDLLAEILESHTWSFAKKWASVASDSTYTMVDDDWDYAYLIPTDFIRMSKTNTDGLKFVRRGDYFLTNEESPFKYEYIWNQTDTTKWPKHFVRAMVVRLCSVLANNLSTKSSRRDSEYWLQIYERVALPEAKKRDAEQSFGEIEEDQGKHTDSNDTWLGAR